MKKNVFVLKTLFFLSLFNVFAHQRASAVTMNQAAFYASVGSWLGYTFYAWPKLIGAEARLNKEINELRYSKEEEDQDKIEELKKELAKVVFAKFIFNKFSWVLLPVIVRSGYLAGTEYSKKSTKDKQEKDALSESAHEFSYLDYKNKIAEPLEDPAFAVGIGDMKSLDELVVAPESFYAGVGAFTPFFRQHLEHSKESLTSQKELLKKMIDESRKYEKEENESLAAKKGFISAGKDLRSKIKKIRKKLRNQIQGIDELVGKIDIVLDKLNR